MKKGTLLPLPFNSLFCFFLLLLIFKSMGFILDPTHEQRSGRVLCNSNFADES